MPALATTDHGYVFGAFDFWKKATDARHQADHRRRGLRHARAPHRTDKTRVKWGDERQRSDDVSGSGAYTHMTLLPRQHAGMHNLFRMASHRLARPGLRQGPAWTASC